MTSEPSEYHSSAKVKIERRPKRSESQLNAMVPMNRPVNSAAMKLAKPSRSNRPCVVGLNRPPLEQPGRDIGGEEQIVELEPAAERDQGHEPADVAVGRQAVEPRRDRRLRCCRHASPGHHYPS